MPHAVSCRAKRFEDVPQEYTVNADQDQLSSTATSLETTSDLSSYVREFQAEVAALPTFRPVMAAIIPAHNESESIEAVLRSLMKQIVMLGNLFRRQRGYQV
jgi:hypothetical protein